ncbi:hypothetical protein AcW1_002109 [Taiwanofungus camphoratus]|nr:hypothetical protein AcW1_002109 [Antrodia cinnamomea]KAI0946024.1 hypothetical protein AcV7_010113 [Antrodia cinnamomea]
MDSFSNLGDMFTPRGNEALLSTTDASPSSSVILIPSSPEYSRLEADSTTPPLDFEHGGGGTGHFFCIIA